MVAGGRTFAGRWELRSWDLHCCLEHADLIRLFPRGSRGQPPAVFPECEEEERMLQETQDREEIVERVAALDIGKAELVCCVRVPDEGRAGRRLQEVETYSTMTRSLLALADRLGRLGVTRVVMEATSDYVRCEGAWVQVGGACGRFGLGRRRSTRASARWPVSALACAAGNCGVRSPG